MTFQSHSGFLWLHSPASHTLPCHKVRSWLFPQHVLTSSTGLPLLRVLAFGRPWPFVLFASAHPPRPRYVSFPSSFLRSHPSQIIFWTPLHIFLGILPSFVLRIFIYFVCVCTYMCVCAMVCMCSWEASPWESILSFYHVGSRQSAMAASALTTEPSHQPLSVVCVCPVLVLLGDARLESWTPGFAVTVIPSHSTLDLHAGAAQFPFTG